MAVLSNTGIRAGASGAGDDAYQIEKSLRFNEDDAAHLSRTFDSGGSTTTWTLSFWIKGHDITQACYVFTGGTGTNSYITMDAGQFRFYSSAHDLKSEARYRDPAAWYHFVVVADTTDSTDNDKTRVYVNGTRLAVADFATHTQPSASAALGDFGSAATHYFDRLTTGNQRDFMLADIHFIDGTALDADSFGETNEDTGQWVPKEYSGSYGTNGFYLKGGIIAEAPQSAKTLTGKYWTQYKGTYQSDTQPNAKTGSTYRIKVGDIFAGLSNGTSYTSAQLFGINKGNAQVWLFSSLTSTDGDDTGGFDLTTSTLVSAWKSTYFDSGTTGWEDKYVSVMDYDGAAADGTDYSITQGPYAPDLSGNGNDWTVNNLSTSAGFGNDVSVDSPTSFNDGGNGTGNYCTMNPLNNGSNVTLSQGNLQTDASSSSWTIDNRSVGTIGMRTGKWYWECHISNHQYNYTGMISTDNLDVAYPGADTTSIGLLTSSGTYYGGGAQAGHGANTGSDVTLMYAFDADNKKMWFGVDGTWLTQGGSNVGNPSAGTYPSHTGFGSSNTTYFPANGTYGSVTCQYNFGARSFAHTPPTGFKALNTYNLPDPTIADPSKHFDTALYTGDESTQSISGLDFSPDVVWTKSRSTTGDHGLFDTVRGAGELLYPNASDAESTVATTLSSFDSNGFTLGDNSVCNTDTTTYASWNWDAGSANVTNDASSTGIGTIDSTYRASPTAGFSIVTYTGNNANPASVAHGLNAKPAMIWVKNRETSSKHWVVYHKALGATKYMYLNSDSTVSTSIGPWNDTEPTSTVWTMQDWSDMNNTDDFVAYLWSEVEAYSKFGSYTGNGVVDGPFIYCGFTPRWLLLKQAHSGYNGSWVMYDTARTPTNSGENWLYTNSDAAEGAAATYAATVTSNGFKMRSTSAENNGSGRNYIFAAFAESSFKYSNAR